MMELKKYKQLLPILLLSAYCIATIITAITGHVTLAGVAYDFALSYERYVAFALVVLCFISFFKFRQYYRYVLLCTIVPGLFNIVTFSALTSTIGFSIGSLSVKFQPAAFWALLVVYIVNHKRAMALIIPPAPTAEIERREVQRHVEDVEKFREKYAGYSVDDLQNILADSRYRPEALEAARQELAERGVNSD